MLSCEGSGQGGKKGTAPILPLRPLQVLGADIATASALHARKDPLCTAESVLDPTIPPSVFGAEIAETEGKRAGRSWLGLLPALSSEGWVCPEEEREAELGNNNRMCNNRMRRADLMPEVSGRATGHFLY